MAQPLTALSSHVTHSLDRDRFRTCLEHARLLHSINAYNTISDGSSTIFWPLYTSHQCAHTHTDR